MQDTQRHRLRDPQAMPMRRPSRAPGRSRSWVGRVKLVVVLLLVALVVGVVVLALRAAAFNDAVSTQPALSLRLFGPFPAASRVNVLLLGYSDESREGAFLSDSMNVLSVDTTTGRSALLAIPRDLWVEGIPAVPQNMKINEAFRIGYYEGGIEAGADLAAEAVTHVTGLPIHGWISLDFQGFQAMVDSIGGITVENPTAFAYTWDETNLLAGNYEGSFDAGTLRLDGERALNYARNRYTSVVSESSDFARSIRQQRVLQAIRAEVSGWRTVPQGLAVADALEGHLHTDLSVADLAMLAGELDVDQRIELTEDVILRASSNSIGQYILVVIGQATSADYSPLHAYIADELANPPQPSSAPSESPPS